MTTRRDFCKGLLAAATFPGFVQTFVGMDFGKDATTITAVWFRGGRNSGRPRPADLFHGREICSFWFQEIAQMPWEEVSKPVPGRPDWHYVCLGDAIVTRKVDKDQEDYKQKTLWFEEATNFQRGSEACLCSNGVSPAEQEAN